MLPDTNLTAEVCPPSARIEEVLLVCQQSLGNMRLSEDEILYSRAQDAVDLRVQFAEGKCVRILAGSSLDDETYEALVGRIHSEVTQSWGRVIARTFLFSDIPVEGYWRYRDEFQILPPGPKAPRPQQLIGPHPFVLEHSLSTSPNKLLEVYRRSSIVRRWALLLGAIAASRVWGAIHRLQMHWVLVKGSPDQVQCCQEFYSVPDEQQDRTSWTPTEGIESIPELDPVSYYSRLPLTGRPLTLPSTARNCLDRVAQLADDDLQRFLRACFWLNHAMEVYAPSQSSAYVALATAIEALLPADSDTQFCIECGRPMGPGPTRKFVDFINRHVPDTGQFRSRREKLYGLRSAIAHGGKLFLTDYDPLHMMHPDGWSHWGPMMDMVHTVRFSLHNWLLR